MAKGRHCSRPCAPSGIVLADEPTAALDDDNARRVITVLRDCASRGGALVVIATHDARFVPTSDHAYTVLDGRLEAA